MSQLGNKLIIYAACSYAFLMQKKFLSKTKIKNCAVMLQAGVSHNSWTRVRLYVWTCVTCVHTYREKERGEKHQLKLWSTKKQGLSVWSHMEINSVKNKTKFVSQQTKRIRGLATIYLQLVQNRYMFRSFTVLQCSHQHCVQPVASDVEVVGYL